MNFIIFFNNVISIIINKLDIKEDTYKLNHSNGDISKQFQFVSNFLIEVEDCSVLLHDNTIKDLIILQNIKKISCSLICKDNKVVGIITDKDLRIYLEDNNDLNKRLNEITNYNFFYLTQDIQIKNLKTIIKKFNKQENYTYIPLIIDGEFKGLFKS